MIIDNIKGLLCGICIVVLLLLVCVSVDYAANDTITAEPEQINTTNCTVINGVHYDNRIISKDKGVAKLHKVVTVKPKLPLISMWAKPSVRSGYAYKWYYRTFINYCPNCHRYNSLLKNPKCVPEREYTCKFCDSDFCGVTGKEKYSWSSKYLRRA